MMLQIILSVTCTFLYASFSPSPPHLFDSSALVHLLYIQYYIFYFPFLEKALPLLQFFTLYLSSVSILIVPLLREGVQYTLFGGMG